MNFEIGANMFRDALKYGSLTKTKKPLIELVSLSVGDNGLIVKGYDNASVIMSYINIKKDHIIVNEEGDILIEPRKIIEVLGKTFKGATVTFKTDNERFYVFSGDDEYSELIADVNLEFPIDFKIENNVPKPEGIEYKTVVKVSETPGLPDVPDITLEVNNGKCRLVTGDETSVLKKVISLRCSGEDISVKLDVDYLKRVFDMIKGEFVMSINEDSVYFLNPRDFGFVTYILVTKEE